VNGQVVGGIGVSGASSAQQDEEIALAGAAALTNNTPVASVNHVPARSVRVAYSKGDTGDTLVTDARFRVNASRRDRAGEAEVHALETDIFYVLKGRATVVTGGEVVEPRVAAPDETRGSSIRGGTEHEIGPGDVLTIPRGVPHWFKTVTAPFRYYVVKSVDGA
jgi:glc operon protein GlcG